MRLDHSYNTLSQAVEPDGEAADQALKETDSLVPTTNHAARQRPRKRLYILGGAFLSIILLVALGTAIGISIKSRNSTTATTETSNSTNHDLLKETNTKIKNVDEEISNADVVQSRLKPGCAPGGNFDLSTWELQLPIGSAGRPTTIPSSALQGCSGYQDGKHQYFFTKGSVGALVMKVPGSPSKSGCVTTPNSQHCRTELREMKSSGGSASWSPLDPVNRLHAKLLVEEAGNAFTGIAIGQIHIDDAISTTPVCQLLYNNTGHIVMAVDQTRGGGDSISTYIGRVPRRQAFTYDISYENNELSVSINEGEAVVLSTYQLRAPKSYFKIGNTNQGDEPTQVEILAISVSHSSLSPSVSTDTHSRGATTKSALPGTIHSSNDAGHSSASTDETGDPAATTEGAVVSHTSHAQHSTTGRKPPTTMAPSPISSRHASSSRSQTVSHEPQATTIITVVLPPASSGGHSSTVVITSTIDPSPTPSISSSRHGTSSRSHAVPPEGQTTKVITVVLPPASSGGQSSTLVITSTIDSLPTSGVLSSRHATSSRSQAIPPEGQVTTVITVVIPPASSGGHSSTVTITSIIDPSPTTGEDSTSANPHSLPTSPGSTTAPPSPHVTGAPTSAPVTTATGSSTLLLPLSVIREAASSLGPLRATVSALQQNPKNTPAAESIQDHSNTVKKGIDHLIEGGIIASLFGLFSAASTSLAALASAAGVVAAEGTAASVAALATALAAASAAVAKAEKAAEEDENSSQSQSRSRTSKSTSSCSVVTATDFYVSCAAATGTATKSCSTYSSVVTSGCPSSVSALTTTTFGSACPIFAGISIDWPPSRRGTKSAPVKGPTSAKGRTPVKGPTSTKKSISTGKFFSTKRPASTKNSLSDEESMSTKHPSPTTEPTNGPASTQKSTTNESSIKEPSTTKKSSSIKESTSTKKATPTSKDTTPTAAPSKSLKCEQPRGNGAPSGASIKSGLIANNAIATMCGTSFSPSSQTEISYNNNYMVIKISRKSADEPLKWCATGLNAMIDSCILSQNYFGGQYEQGGEVYTISNSAYPRNQDPLAPPKASTAAPSLPSTSPNPPHSSSSPEPKPNPDGTNVHIADGAGCALINGSQRCAKDAGGTASVYQSFYNIASTPGEAFSSTQILSGFDSQNNNHIHALSTCQLQARWPSNYGDVYYRSDGCLYDSSNNTISNQCCSKPENNYKPVLNPYCRPAPSDTPSQTSGNHDGSSICASLRKSSCLHAAARYVDDIIYDRYTSATWPDHSGADAVNGVLGFIGEGLEGLFGIDYGCTVIWKCDNDDAYRTGMTGKQIKYSMLNIYNLNKAKGCGSTYLSNGCHITVNGCNSCSDQGRAHTVWSPYAFGDGTYEDSGDGFPLS